jgi:hypothetical protein
MQNIHKIIKNLKKLGFTTKSGQGSRIKLYPPDKNKPFYSLHLNNDGKAFFPLNRFSKNNWNIDLETI